VVSHMRADPLLQWVTMPTLSNVAVLTAATTAGLLAASLTVSGPASRGASSAATTDARSAVADAPHLAVVPSDRGPAPRSGERHIALTRWGPHTFARGRFHHVRNKAGLVVGRHPDTVRYRDPYGSPQSRTYDRGRWSSPWVHERFDLTELIASYNARTPVATFIEISIRGRTRAGRQSSWDSLGRWASHDRRFHRMSLGSQSDDLSRVAVDTLVTNSPHGYASWQLRITLMRRTGADRTPTVTMVGAMASRLPGDASPTSRPHRRLGRDLDVPRFSQQIHAGEYPQWNGGGEAWCSPTSTSMVVAYWNRGPTRKQYAWVRKSYRQPWVDYAARYTYASGYDGTGDWPFNTAYAARFGLDAFVTRLRSLRQAELFIRAGIPLVASISFGPGELDGAPISSTAGHLLVIRGFTRTGKVVANDPAAASAAGVRRVYRRGQFERAWVGATGGVVYVIHPHDKRLPTTTRTAAW
jgi:Peptidase_C39 like family